MRAATPPLLRSLNVQAILRVLHATGPLSRTELARQVNISGPTTAGIVDELVEAGWLEVAGDAVPSGGRPARAVALNADSAEVIAVDVGGSRIKAGRFNLQGVLTQERIVTTELTGTTHQVADLLRELSTNAAQMRCIVVGAPGFVRDGVVVEAANIPEWRGVPLVETLRTAVDGHYLIDNDVNLAALGEARCGAGRDVGNLVFVTLGTGIGAGILVNHQLIRGAAGAAGEVGFLVPDRDLLDQPRGPGGALEARASTVGLGRLWEERTHTAASAPEIVSAARAGSESAQAVVRDWTRYLASALIAVSTVVNPERVILGGGGGAAFDLLAPDLTTLLARHLPFPPELAPSALGDRAALYGGLDLGMAWLLEAIPHRLAEARRANRNYQEI